MRHYNQKYDKSYVINYNCLLHDSKLLLEYRHIKDKARKYRRYRNMLLEKHKLTKDRGIL